MNAALIMNLISPYIHINITVQACPYLRIGTKLVRIGKSSEECMHAANHFDTCVLQSVNI